jgi:uncharacterized membrane protein (DUF106 family)
MVEIFSLIQQNPRLSIIIIALTISFFITIINYFFLDKEKMREIKKRQKEIQVKMKEHQKNREHEKMLELQKEMFSDMGTMFRHSMKPMLITIVPILFLFSFMRSAYAETSIASSWFWYYLISAMAGSMIFRKVFRLP